jgi:hypothetical protein
VTAYATPGVYLERRATAGPIPVLRSDVTGFVGIAERGPVGRAVAAGSWDAFTAVFGGLIPHADLAYAVRAFFENGGRRCHVVRVAEDAQAAEASVAGVRVQARSPGGWGDALAVLFSRTTPAATRSQGVQPHDRRASAVASLDGFTAGALVRVTQGGEVAWRVVAAVDPATSRLGWELPLDPAIDIHHPFELETIEIGLTVTLDGHVEEVFSGLSAVPGHPRFAATVVADRSRLVEIVEAPGLAQVGKARLVMRGGRDGLAGLRPESFIAGCAALEPVDEVAIVAVPDAFVAPRPVRAVAPPPPHEVDPCAPATPDAIEAPRRRPAVTEQVPAFGAEERARVQQALVAHCERLRDRFAILDPPPGDWRAVATWRRRFDSKYAALYHPWVLVHDPLRTDGRLVRAVPPSGHVAGVFARVDNAVGVHHAPANEALAWATGAAAAVTAELQGLLNPIGVNCIRMLPGRGLRVYGARTVSAEPAWRYVNVRRLMTVIEEAVDQALQWAVFEPHDVYLRETVRLAVTGLLERVWEAGALAGANPDEAFFVNCDETNNPPADAALGRLLVDVGVAPVRPAEFVVFRVGRTNDQLEITEA